MTDAYFDVGSHVRRVTTSSVEAMRPVYRAHPDDHDVASLFVDALMCVSLRRLWDLTTGKPVGPNTVEADEVLNRALGMPPGDSHPALNHLYVHFMEMSSRPELAMAHADRLRRMVPGAGDMAQWRATSTTRAATLLKG